MNKRVNNCVESVLKLPYQTKTAWSDWNLNQKMKKKKSVFVYSEMFMTPVDLH